MCIYLMSRIKTIGNYSTRGGNGKLYRPIGVAFDRNDYLYIADNGHNKVKKFDVNGNYFQQFGSDRSAIVH